MKKRLLLYLSLSLLIIGSCDQLEVPVDNRASIESLDEIEKTLTGLYPNAFYLFTDYLADYYEENKYGDHAINTVYNRLLYIYTYSTGLLTKENSPQFGPVNLWLKYYYNIQNSSLLIEKLEKLTVKSDEENLKKHLLGEALAIRAYCHFMLINIFAKHYDVATAESDKGIPYVTKSDKSPITNYKYANVKYIYDAVIKDLQKAVDLIDNTIPKKKAFHFSKEAVNALLSRAFLYKGDYDQCIKYSDEVITKNNAILDIRDINAKNVNSSGTFDMEAYGKIYFSEKNNSYLLMSNSSYILYPAYFWSGFYPTAYQSWLSKEGYPITNRFIRTSPLFADVIFMKWMPFLYTGSRDMNFPLLTVDEVYFNRAESKIQKNDLTGAKEDLDFITSKGFIITHSNLQAKINKATTKEALLELLVEFKKIRFEAEGLRWFDIKRHKIEIVHIINSTEYKANETNGNYIVEIPLEVRALENN